MNFIDSNIFAYAFYQNKFQGACQKIIENGGVTDTVCLIEAFNIIELETTREFAVQAIKSILKSQIEIVDADVNLIFDALKKTGQKLKFIDLIHYTVALSHNCSFIASFDHDFDDLDIPRIES